MSSPPDGASPGPQSGGNQQSGKKKRPELDKAHGRSRPGTSRHGSSFLNRLHRKHDSKRHPEHAPLLADPEAEETPEPEDRNQDQASAGLGAILKKALSLAKEAGPLAKKVAGMIQDAATASGQKTKKAVGSTKRHVQRHDKKYMAGLIALLTAATVTLGIAFGLGGSSGAAGTMCTTPACLQAANNIIKNLHPDIAAQVSTNGFARIVSAPDPCEKFDEYVCGGFAQHHDLRSDQNEVSTGSLMSDVVGHTLKSLLEQHRFSVDDKAVKGIFAMAKKDYDSCMDEKEIQKLGLEPLKALVDQLKADLPKGKGASPNHGYSLQAITIGDSRGDFLTDAMADCALLGVSALVKLHVGPDIKDPKHQAVFASPVYAIGLPSAEYYKDVDIVADYTKACNQSLDAFYQAPTNASVIWRRGSNYEPEPGILSDKIISLESKLAEIVPPAENELNIAQTYNKVPVSDFKKMLPQVDIEAVFNKVAATTTTPKNIIVSSTDYIQQLSSVLQETDKSTLQAFFVWKTIQAWASRVEDPILQPLADFVTKLGGTERYQPEERWRQCVKDVDADLGWITSYLYVKAVSQKSIKDNANKIVDSMKVGFTKVVIAATWMSQDERKAAAVKARGIESEIGYPTSMPDVKDASSIKDYYDFDGLKIGSDTYFQNGIAATQQRVRRQWARSKAKKHEWHVYPTDIGAQYSSTANKVFLPAALLQQPVLYDKSLPAYVSYGSFGAIVAHEMSHAFGPVGSHYDDSGTYNDWWSKETAEHFEKKAQCFADQYSQYSVEGPSGKVSIDGNLIRAQAIADAGGAHAAFRSWKAVNEKTPTRLLPGLKSFTKEQIFWLSYGTYFCSKLTPERKKEIALSNQHAPNAIRIRGTVSNSKAFREAWSCARKEPTCDLW